MHRFRSIIGNFLRGVRGICVNHCERTPEIPKLTHMEIGRSIEGRPLSIYTIGNGPRHILLAGGMHGNEIGTIKLMHHFLDWLSQHAAQFKHLTIHVLPCLNPDGYALAQTQPDYFGDGRIGRFNGNRVDLNRNFPTHSWAPTSDWTHGKNYTERTAVSAGGKPGSEPETKALLQFIKDQKVEVWFMFHNKARDVVGSCDERAQKLTVRYAQKTGFKYFSEAMWRDLKQTGTAKEWCDENGVSFVEVEGSTRWGSDWKLQRPALEDLLKTLNSL